MSTQPTESPDLSVLDHMPHLTQPTEDAKKVIQKQLAQKKEIDQEKADEQNPMLKEEYIFDFKYKDGRGRVWSGKFKNKIVNVMNRQGIGALQAQWQLGIAHACFDPEISSMNYILAHMAVSLEVVQGGEWAGDMRQLTDIDLIQALYAEVSAHEATFHGRRPAQESGKTNG